MMPLGAATDEAARIASAENKKAWRAHDVDYNVYPFKTCKCGRTFGSSQGLGLHRGAELRRADAKWDATYSRELMRLRPTDATRRALGL